MERQAFTSATSQAHLLDVCQSFSKYVGGAGFSLPKSFARAEFGSALDTEMMLWTPTSERLPKRYRPNDIEHNSWQAMQQMGIKGTFSRPERVGIFQLLRDTFPSLDEGACPQIEFDRWFQHTANHLRHLGLQQPGARGSNPAHKPTALGTLGLAQKLINIYLKYAFCWAVAGQYSDNGFSPCGVIPNITDFTFALHAPIDRILLLTLRLTHLGQKLTTEGFLDKSAGRIKSSTGQWAPWSKLDCWDTYWQLQKDLRSSSLNTSPFLAKC